jgi:hypothetical protein
MSNAHPLSTAVEEEVQLCRVSDLSAQPVRWLWPGRLALGKLSLLEGDPGLGKSLITLDLCARVSRGLPFPDSSGGQPCNCLVLNAEDGEADTVRSRLVALGADLDRVFVLTRGLTGQTIRLPSKLNVLDDALERTQARLTVIDPLLAFLDASVASGNDQSVRRALTPLAALAARHETALLMARHLNKRGGKQAIYRGGGAIGLVGACRSAWLVGQDPVVAGQCVLAQVKNNLAAVQGSLAYRVTAQDGGAPQLSWLGTSPWTADQLVAGSTRGLARIQARSFLQQALKDGPRLTRELWAEGEKQGLKARTLQRAMQDLLIRRERVVEGGVQKNYWLLPGQVLPAAAPEADDPYSLEPWLAPLREKYPSATPLDEE